LDPKQPLLLSREPLPFTLLSKLRTQFLLCTSIAKKGKVKYPDPVYECVSENVLETWQKNNHTFKKTEYTMKLEVAGKCYFGSANTKKAAKTAVSTEAWNIVRSGNM